jgi:hypothetical protein
MEGHVHGTDAPQLRPACPRASGLWAASEAAESRYFDSAGVRIHYVEEGSGEPVVLIHGYTTDLNEQFGKTGIFRELATR